MCKAATTVAAFAHARISISTCFKVPNMQRKTCAGWLRLADDGQYVLRSEGEPIIGRHHHLPVFRSSTRVRGDARKRSGGGAFVWFLSHKMGRWCVI